MQFADELEGIADAEGFGTALETPLRQMGGEFRAGQLNIDAGTILALCSGEVPTPPDADVLAALQSYVARVRSEAPTLASVADADLLSAASAVCSTVESGMGAYTDAEAYLVLTGTAATAMGHSNPDETAPAIQAAADVICPASSVDVQVILRY